MSGDVERRWHDPFQYAVFDVENSDRIAIPVRDILPFVGRLLGTSVWIGTRVYGIVLGVMAGGNPIGSDPLQTKVTVMTRDRTGSGVEVKEVSWLDIFCNNPHLYADSISRKRTANVSSDRIIDLRGLFHGKDEAGGQGPGSGAPAVHGQERPTSV